jgi:hypothetical protein
MITWLTAMEVSLDGVDTTDDAALLEIWKANYDESAKPKGMTK